MYPKRNIHQLNVRREINRRLRFVKRRIPETVLEYYLFQGTIAELPEEMRPPPVWARDAAKLAWEWGFGAILSRITPEYIRGDVRGALREITAINETLMAYVSSPKLTGELGQIGDSELAEFQTEFASVGKTLLQSLRKLDARLDDLLPPATHEQLRSYQDRASKVTRALAPDEDELLGVKTISGKICYAVWFFWPDFERKRPTAAELHRWLAETLGIFTSLKTVEAIHTKLRLKPRDEN